VTGELLRDALTKLAAARERPYIDEDADREAAAGYYADIEPGFEALSALLESTHRHRPHYRPADELYPSVDLQPDGKLRSLYTDEVWEPEELIEEAARIEERRARMASAAAQEETDPYNCEHVVPQSWFDHDEPMRGDLHHLFTCEKKCNAFRGNTPYTDFPDYLKVVRESCGKSEGSGFEPWRGKGPAARATLYFTLRYPGLGRYSGETLELLLGWHEAEPAGEYERHRNAAIFERQGNRNPLVDHPEWAAEIEFAEGL
jgi:endonuclease G, mitochondrial